MKNTITIDPSITSTAICINGTRYLFTRKKYILTKKEELTKWYKIAEKEINYVCIENEVEEKDLDYSNSEIYKLWYYNEITNAIIQLINDTINKNIPTEIFIEGFSYSSAAGDLIDLVHFSTQLRLKLYLNISKSIHIIAPTTLKLESCKFAYQGKDIGKKKPKIEYRNNDGISGGSFKKREMYQALIEQNNIKDTYISLLKDNSLDVLKMKSVPKPLEDVNDAMLMYYIYR